MNIHTIEANLRDALVADAEAMRERIRKIEYEIRYGEAIRAFEAKRRAAAPAANGRIRSATDCALEWPLLRKIDRVLRDRADPMEAKEIARRIDYNLRAIHTKLAQMEEIGRLTRVRYDEYLESRGIPLRGRKKWDGPEFLWLAREDPSPWPDAAQADD